MSNFTGKTINEWHAIWQQLSAAEKLVYSDRAAEMRAKTPSLPSMESRQGRRAALKSIKVIQSEVFIFTYL